MDIFANFYILIIFGIIYAAIAFNCKRLYKTTGQKIFRILTYLFILTLFEWVMTVAYEAFVGDVGYYIPRLLSDHKLYQVPRVIVKNSENILIALCLSALTTGGEPDFKKCHGAFVLIIAFSLFEIICFYMPDTYRWMYLRSVCDSLCLLAVTLYFSFPWHQRSKIFKRYAVFSFVALPIIFVESYAKLYIPFVRNLIPEFYESGDLYYFLLSLMIFFGVSHVGETVSKKKIEADLEKKMEAELEQRMEEYKEEVLAEQALEEQENEISKERLEEFCKSYKLTKRESEITCLIAEGKSNAEIAELLKISAATVRVHQHTAFQKVNVAGRQELIDLIHIKSRSYNKA